MLTLETTTLYHDSRDKISIDQILNKKIVLSWRLQKYYISHTIRPRLVRLYQIQYNINTRIANLSKVSWCVVDTTTRFWISYPIMVSGRMILLANYSHLVWHMHYRGTVIGQLASRDLKLWLDYIQNCVVDTIKILSTSLQSWYWHCNCIDRPTSCGLSRKIILASTLEVASAIVPLLWFVYWHYTS